MGRPWLPAPEPHPHRKQSSAAAPTGFSSETCPATNGMAAVRCSKDLLREIPRPLPPQPPPQAFPPSLPGVPPPAAVIWGGTPNAPSEGAVDAQPGNSHLRAQRCRLLGGATASGEVVDKLRALLCARASDDLFTDVDAAVLGVASAVVGTAEPSRADVLELHALGEESGPTSQIMARAPAAAQVIPGLAAYLHDTLAQMQPRPTELPADRAGPSAEAVRCAEPVQMPHTASASAPAAAPASAPESTEAQPAKVVQVENKSVMTSAEAPLQVDAGTLTHWNLADGGAASPDLITTTSVSAAPEEPLEPPTAAPPTASDLPSFRQAADGSLAADDSLAPSSPTCWTARLEAQAASIASLRDHLQQIPKADTAAVLANMSLPSALSDLTSVAPSAARRRVSRSRASAQSRREVEGTPAQGKAGVLRTTPARQVSFEDASTAPPRGRAAQAPAAASWPASWPAPLRETSDARAALGAPADMGDRPALAEQGEHGAQASKLLNEMRQALQLVEELHGQVGGNKRRDLDRNALLQSGAGACTAFYCAAAALHGLQKRMVEHSGSLPEQQGDAVLQQADADAQRARAMIGRMEAFEGVYIERAARGAESTVTGSCSLGTSAASAEQLPRTTKSAAPPLPQPPSAPVPPRTSAPPQAAALRARLPRRSPPQPAAFHARPAACSRPSTDSSSPAMLARASPRLLPRAEACSHGASPQPSVGALPLDRRSVLREISGLMRGCHDELTKKREEPPVGEVRSHVDNCLRPVELAVSTKPAAVWPWPSATLPPASHVQSAQPGSNSAGPDANTIWLVAQEIKSPAPVSQPPAVDAGWARLADYDQAYGSWRQRWFSAPLQEIGAGSDSTCVTAAGVADTKQVRHATETAPSLTASPITAPSARPAAEQSRAQMRCQMVQTEDSMLTESNRLQAAFVIQRAAIRQRASGQRREPDSGTSSGPPVLGPTDAGASSSGASRARSSARQPAKGRPFGALISEQWEEQQKQWSLLQEERRALQDEQEQLASSAHQQLLAEQQRLVNEQRSQHQLLLDEQRQVTPPGHSPCKSIYSKLCCVHVTVLTPRLSRTHSSTSFGLNYSGRSSCGTWDALESGSRSSAQRWASTTVCALTTPSKSTN